MGYVTKGNEIVIVDLASDILVYRGTVVEVKRYPATMQYGITFDTEERPYPIAWELSMMQYVELDRTGSLQDGNISIEISKLSKPIPISNKCLHPNKKVVRLIASAYWYCPDCKADLGDVK